MNPSPAYPKLQEQVKEPTVSVHIALEWHGMYLHSFVSANKLE